MADAAPLKNRTGWLDSARNFSRDEIGEGRPGNSLAHMSCGSLERKGLLGKAEMSGIRFLERFPVLRTRDPDQLFGWMETQAAVRKLEVSHGQRKVDCVIHHRPSEGVSLTYGRYGAAYSAQLAQNDYFVQDFVLSGAGAITWNRNEISISPQVGGVVGGPGSEAHIVLNEDYSHIFLWFSPATLTRKLSAMIGRPIDPPLRIEGSAAANPAYLAGQRRLAVFLAEELDREEETLSPTVTAEIEQAIIVAFLLGNEHNYSHWLNGTPSRIAPRQVRTAAEYIEQNWDQPITIEALSHITQTSARSLFHLFRRTYGVSPMVFVRQVRLRHARQMLSNPTQEATVTSVGFLCGFSNMGNFARIYFNAFGEHPSDTLKAHR